MASFKRSITIHSIQDFGAKDFLIFHSEPVSIIKCPMFYRGTLGSLIFTPTTAIRQAGCFFDFVSSSISRVVSSNVKEQPGEFAAKNPLLAS